MRDLKRIEPFCEKLAKVWGKRQDYRFGQLVYFLAEKMYQKNKIGDVFIPEDDAWEELLNDIIGE